MAGIFNIINKGDYKLLALSICIVLCASCHRKENRLREQIVIDLLSNVQDTLNYSSFVDSISYISLETTDQCLVGSIKDVIISDKYILVLDKILPVVWIFDKEGHYLTKIDRKGDGPEEYVNLSQFDYDRKKEHVLLLDSWTQSILFYGLDGSFVKRVKLDTSPSDFVRLEDNNYVFSRSGEVDSLAGIYLVDAMGKFTSKLIARDDKYLFNNFSDNWELSVFDGIVGFMAPCLENTVYHYQSGKLIKAYPIVIEPKPIGSYNKETSIRNMLDFLRTNYIETSQWIFATYWCNKYGVRIIFYSKEGDFALVGKETKNDIDGVEYDGKASASDNNTLTFWLRSEDDTANPVLQILHLK